MKLKCTFCRVVPISAHAAFDKGAAYLGIKVHTIPIHPETRQVDIKRVARAINRNTIMVRAVPDLRLVR